MTAGHPGVKGISPPLFLNAFELAFGFARHSDPALRERNLSALMPYLLNLLLLSALPRRLRVEHTLIHVSPPCVIPPHFYVYSPDARPRDATYWISRS